MRNFFKLMRGFCALIVCLTLASCAPAGASESAEQARDGFSQSEIISFKLIQAARDEIRIYREDGIEDTACDHYIERVIERAGFPFGPFLANGFNETMHEYLPTWQMRGFSFNSKSRGLAQLQSFLDNAPNGSAFLAQWQRVGDNGHVALIAKTAPDEFVIYQAQLGTALPHEEPIKLGSLLYAKGRWGDRSHLRLFFN
jgi:hypothetical protein